MTGSAIVTPELGSAPGEGAAGALDDAQALLPLLEACRLERRWLDTKSRIWVALSGGADSTALLRAVLKAGLSAPIHVTHIDHGVQSESKQWALHCVALCEQLGVPVTVHEVTPPADGHFASGFEAWARGERYRHWGELLQADDVLLCAHHADDQAETIALRLLQGRLPLPMPVRRAVGSGVLLRPLLGLRGAQLRDAMKAGGFSWVEDPSNKDSRLLRNAVRGLLPKLEQRSRSNLNSEPGGGADWFAALNRLGALVARLQAGLQSNFGSKASVAVAGELVRVPLSALPGAAALQGILALFDSGPVSQRQSRDALIRLREQAAAGAQRGSARGGVRVGRQSSDGAPNAEAATARAPELRLFVDAADIVIWREPIFAPIVLERRGRQEVILPHGTLVVEFDDSIQVESAAGGAERLASMVVRPLAAADRLLHNARTHRVKELLRASGVPRWARGSYPVVAVGTQILAVPALNVPVSSARASGKGWLRDGGAPEVPIRLSWTANLPS